VVVLQEFSSGHVKGALNLDSTAFSDNSLVDKLVEQLHAKSQVSTLHTCSSASAALCTSYSAVL
jgi:hypothetical protein